MTEEKIREENDIIKNSRLLSNIHCSAGPKKGDIFHWNVIMRGPIKSCYEKGLFKLIITFPDNYPIDPPDIKFVTKIYHPNISLEDGRICVSSKSTDWDENQNIINVIYSVYDLLNNPSTAHGLNQEALLLYKNDIEAFKKKASDYTKEFAISVNE